MQLSKILQYIEENVSPRLKSPYVSKDYSPEDKEELLTGLQIALQNTEEKEFTTAQIINVFNGMMPKLRANMKFPTRKAAVAFATSKDMMSEQGILELLEWAEKNRAGYGPRFELRGEGAYYFTSVQHMRETYNCQTNTSMAKTLFNQLRGGNCTLVYVPPYDSFNPFFDQVHLTENESEQLEPLKSALAGYEVLNKVSPKFEQLVAEFNQIEQPSILDIASFIKSMILLHPFPNGNGRVFTLGILNQLLLKNKFGICLNLEPHIALFSSEEIAKAIQANLIKCDAFFELEKLAGNDESIDYGSSTKNKGKDKDSQVPIQMVPRDKASERVPQVEKNQNNIAHDNSVASQATCLELFNWFLQLREANMNNKCLVAELEKMSRNLAHADNKYQAVSIFKDTCTKIMELGLNQEINYPSRMQTAESILEKLQTQSGRWAVFSSYNSNDKNVFVLLMLSKLYIVHLKEELLLKAKLSSNEALRANPEYFNDQPVIKLTLQKYHAVTELCDFLEGEGNAIDKLRLFKQGFAKNKTLLETRRDNACLTFLKAVLTLFTLSAAYFLGIWETKGKKFGNEVEAITNPRVC